VLCCFLNYIKYNYGMENFGKFSEKNLADVTEMKTAPETPEKERAKIEELNEKEDAVKKKVKEIIKQIEKTTKKPVDISKNS